MEQPRQGRFTADEFIAWAMEQPSDRYELENGLVVAMSPERVRHAIAKGQAWLALRNAIAAHGLACQAVPDGATVRIDDRTIYEPDALIRCGGPLRDDAIVVADPIVVLEVVSPSSREIDLGAKLASYFRLPSVRHCLIVDVDSRVLIHHQRGEDGNIGIRVVDEGALTLDPPGLAFNVREVFDGV
jgi:Uma2 family endonuclease